MPVAGTAEQKQMLKQFGEWWVIEKRTHREVVELFRVQSAEHPWCRYFVDDNPYFPANLNSKCRIGYVPFEDCVQDRIFYLDKSGAIERLAAGGIVTRINWNGNPESLPDGWQGVVRKSHEDAIQRVAPNTLVALLAFTPSRYRGCGLSKAMISKMLERAKECGYGHLLVPALPPSQFEKDKVALSMREISESLLDDGRLYDFWVRLHTEKGAKVIGTCETSHRFVLPVKEFRTFVSSTPVETSGEHLVLLDRDRLLGVNGEKMWETVYVDKERDFVTFNWGCVWMDYLVE